MIRLQIPILLGILALMSISPCPAELRQLGMMSGTFATSDGRMVRATLDMRANNADYGVTGGDYYFDIALWDDDPNAKPRLYGVALEDQETKQVYAALTYPVPQTRLHLQAVVSGNEFLGDGSVGWEFFTSPVSGAELKRRMDDANAPIVLASAQYTDEPQTVRHDVLVQTVQDPANSKTSITAPGEGYVYRVIQTARSGDLDKIKTWLPSDVSSPQSVSATVPSGEHVAWVRDETTFIRHVTLKYNYSRQPDIFSKQRIFDVEMTNFGPLHLVTGASSPTTDGISTAPNLPTISVVVAGLFFEGDKADGQAPVRRVIPMDGTADAPDKLAPLEDGQAIAVTLDPRTAGDTLTAQWSTNDGGSAVQAVSSQILTVPIPASAVVGQPISMTLQESDGTTVQRQYQLPLSVDWAHPVAVPINFAALDGLDKLGGALK